MQWCLIVFQSGGEHEHEYQNGNMCSPAVAVLVVFTKVFHLTCVVINSSKEMSTISRKPKLKTRLHTVHATHIKNLTGSGLIALRSVKACGLSFSFQGI